jgi:hypothetical protein
MDLSFASPAGAFVAFAVVLPLAGLLVFERRARRVRSTLRLPQGDVRTHAPTLAALASIAFLLALAAMQPVLARATARVVRTDAQAYVVFDVSLSMAASSGRDAPTRITRAKRLAIRFRDALPEVPMAVSSFVVRSVPHLFPTSDEAVFANVVHDSVQLGIPPPTSAYKPGERATDLGSVGELGSNGYFDPQATHRLIVVFSDGESDQTFPAALAGALRGTHVKTIFVHVWAAGERIYLPHGEVDPNYEADPAGGAVLAALASATGGRTFSEHDLTGIVGAARAALGHGHSARRGMHRSQTPLAPWLVIVAALPLAATLRRKNVS